MKRGVIAVIVLLITLLVAAFAIWLRDQMELARRYQCLSILRSTGTTLAMYREMYNGRLPHTFSLMSNVMSTPFFYVCPWDSKSAHRKTRDSWTNVTEWMDYIYIPWPSVTAANTNYPLMYDRRLSNHGGKGVHVLLVEQAVYPAAPMAAGSFHGQFFWDEGATRLQAFAAAHPDLDIPMPEDLR